MWPVAPPRCKLTGQLWPTRNQSLDVLVVVCHIMYFIVTGIIYLQNKYFLHDSLKIWIHNPPLWDMILACNLWWACSDTRRRSSATVSPSARGKVGVTKAGHWHKTWHKWTDERKTREGKRERVRKRGSVQVTDTQTEGGREGAREDLSLEDMSNSHATGSNAWESPWLLYGLTAASLSFYCLQCQTTVSRPASPVLQGYQPQSADEIRSNRSCLCQNLIINIYFWSLEQKREKHTCRLASLSLLRCWHFWTELAWATASLF